MYWGCECLCAVLENVAHLITLAVNVLYSSNVCCLCAVVVNVAFSCNLIVNVVVGCLCIVAVNAFF